eukprot:474473-Rhodomonas_salina.1
MRERRRGESERLTGDNKGERGEQVGGSAAPVNRAPDSGVERKQGAAPPEVDQTRRKLAMGSGGAAKEGAVRVYSAMDELTRELERNGLVWTGPAHMERSALGSKMAHRDDVISAANASDTKRAWKELVRMKGTERVGYIAEAEIVYDDVRVRTAIEPTLLRNLSEMKSLYDTEMETAAMM